MRKLNVGDVSQLADEQMTIQANYCNNLQTLLWCRGNGCLSIFNTISFQIEDVKDFWFNSSKSRKVTPLMVVANPTGTKIFGLANDKSDVSGFDLMIYWAGGKRITQSTALNYSQLIGQWAALETWPEDNYSQILVAGELDGDGVVGFLSFDEKLQPGLFQKVSDKGVSCLTRLVGSSSILVGFLGKLIEYKVTKKGFTPGRAFSLPSGTELIDIKVRHDKIIALDSHGDLFIRTTKKKFDAVVAFQKEAALSTETISSSLFKSRPTLNVNGVAAANKFSAKMIGALNSRHERNSGTFEIDTNSVQIEKQSVMNLSLMESTAATFIRKDLLFSNEFHLKASLSQGQMMKINLSEAKNKSKRLLCSGADLMIAGDRKVAEFRREGQGPYTFAREVINKSVHSFSNQNGDLILQTVDNLFVVWSRISGKQLKSFTGSPEEEDLSEYFVVKQPAEQIECVLWYKGNGNFALVDTTKDYQIIDLDGFCKDEQGNPADPIMAIMISKPQKVIVLLNPKDSEYWIKYYDPSKQKEKAYNLQNVADKDRKKILETIIQATVLEESGRTNVFYMAGKCKIGGSGPDKGKSILIVCGIKFSSPNLELQDYFPFDKRPELKTVGSLKTISAPNKVDYVLVGTELQISILKVNKEMNFSMVHQFTNLHSGIVSGLDLFGTSLYSVSHNDPHMMMITLPNNTKDANSTSERRKVVEFTDPAITNISLPPNVRFCRITVSADNSYLIASGANGGLYMVNGLKKSKYTITESTLAPEESARAVFIKSLPDSSTLVHYHSSSDLISYDKDWRVLSKFEGVKTQNNDKLNRICSFRKSLFTEDDKYVLFYKGDTNLMKLELTNLDVEEIDGFFVPPNKPKTEIQAVTAVGDVDGATLAGLSHVSGSAYICIKEAGESMKFYEAKIRMPQINSLSCLNVSTDGKALIVGGSSDPNFSGFGIMAAYTFDRKLKSINLQLYKESYHKCISCISRIRNSSKFVVGMTSTVLIVDFLNNEKFITLCVTKNVVSSKL